MPAMSVSVGLYPTKCNAWVAQYAGLGKLSSYSHRSTAEDIFDCCMVTKPVAGSLWYVTVRGQSQEYTAQTQALGAGSLDHGSSNHLCLPWPASRLSWECEEQYCLHMATLRIHPSNLGLAWNRIDRRPVSSSPLSSEEGFAIVWPDPGESIFNP